MPSSDGKATAADYTDLMLGEVYAVTWAEGLTPDAVLDRWRVRRRLGRHTWPEANWADLPGVRRDEAVVAVTVAGGWALVFEEMSSYDDAPLRRLSASTRVVSNYHNFEADDRFVIFQDGVIEVDFDPNTPTMRTGRRPDMLVPEMNAAGLDMSGLYLDPADPGYRDVPYDAAALALTERLTGVRLTDELLHSSSYLAATVESPLGGAVINEEEPRVQASGPG
ncbi:hypothetical protein KOI35_17605 [Actinoplanes bogorensis]|uniref:Uncharacterized protein n=1 Tax=Paractinoplanes bogorensis TaxID=1610840 RepID=A0ABS5YPC9_9ACTN|nr:DUF6461 domain-containing protein [Actinoplanes bogorensis]MBU2665324.1 hypothetical protein [Actinoplanes bogorensis]